MLKVPLERYDVEAASPAGKQEVKHVVVEFDPESLADVAHA